VRQRLQDGAAWVTQKAARHKAPKAPEAKGALPVAAQGTGMPRKIWLHLDRVQHYQVAFGTSKKNHKTRLRSRQNCFHINSMTNLPGRSSASDEVILHTDVRSLRTAGTWFGTENLLDASVLVKSFRKRLQRVRRATVGSIHEHRQRHSG
jgi:hypothetical protein